MFRWQIVFGLSINEIECNANSQDEQSEDANHDSHLIPAFDLVGDRLNRGKGLFE